MKRLRVTVPCVRPAVAASTDQFGNTATEARAVVNFNAAFFPPDTKAGSQIIDGALRTQTITKPTLMVEPRTENAAAFVAGAIRSGDALTVNGETGWQVDGDLAAHINAISSKHHLMVIELRRTVG